MVEALLTKKSLGLLDPKHPSAHFAEGPVHEQKSFSEEAEANGIDMDVSTSVSDAPVHAKMALSAVPYADVGVAHHHDMFSFKPTDNDDQMVNSVLGAVAELKGQGDDSTADSSLLSSARQTTSVETPSRPMTRPRLGRPAAQHEGGMPSLDWGNPHTGTPVEQQQPAPQPQPQVSMGQQTAFVKNIDSRRIDLQPVADWGNAPVAVAGFLTPPKAEPKKEASADNPYLQGIDLSNNVDGAVDYSQRALDKLNNNAFHKMANSFRAEAPKLAEAAKAADPLPSTSELGDSFAKDVKAARTNEWKRSLDSTSWGNEGKPKTQYLQQSAVADDNESTPAVSMNRISSWLSGPTHAAKKVAAPAAPVNGYDALWK